MSNKAIVEDRVWREVAATLRVEQGLHPISDEDIRRELTTVNAGFETESSVEEIVDFAMSDHGCSDPAATTGLSVAHLEEVLDATGVVSHDELREFDASFAKGKRPEDLAGYAAALLQQGKLATYRSPSLGGGVLYGEYLVLGLIGAGGMGQVFRAVHLQMDRIVALKVLSPEATRSMHNVRRFKREVRAIARLNHPHIVMAYDAGDAAGVPYLAMEYINGDDLGRMVARLGPLSLRLAYEYVMGAARGLAYAHGQGVVHRDVKPSNLLVDGSGAVKVSDLGLARFRPEEGRAIADDSEVTAAGVAMGTYNYMAPEQIDDASQADHRADIYSLGCTLFYLLVGHSPAQGSTTQEKAAWHREGAIPSLCSFRPDVGSDLDMVFRRAVAKSPEERYQSMDELEQALASCEATVVQTPPGSVVQVSLAAVESGTSAVGESTALPLDTATHSTIPASKPDSGRTVIAKVIIALGLLCSIGIISAGVGSFWGDGRLGSSSNQHGSGGAAPVVRAPVGADWKTMVNSVGMRFTLVPAGSFLMGSPETDPDSYEDEWPQHHVEISQFYMGTYELTQRQYDSVMRPEQEPIRKPIEPFDLPAIDKGNLPVVRVSRDDAVDFCLALSKLPAEVAAGRSYRLPREAEWEYACRAGTTTTYYFGDTISSDEANVGRGRRPATAKYPGRPQLREVGSYEPNAFGLFDMHGNVWEWVGDRHGRYGPERSRDPRGAAVGDEWIQRGGAYGYDEHESRCANRAPTNFVGKTFVETGIRVVCVLQDEGVSVD